MYTLEDLIEKFNDHAAQDDKNRDEWKKSWEDNNKGEPLPDHLKDDFSLPKALACICHELLKLRNE